MTPDEPPNAGARSAGATRSSQRIVEQFRTQIRRGQLAPGDRLPPEREMCERYGVSRVTIREALRVLEASGLVSIRLGSRGGSFVTAPTPERTAGSVADYFTLAEVTPEEVDEARTVFELGLVRLACERATDDDVEHLARIYDELERAWRRGRYDQRVIRDFHLQLAHAVHNSAIDVLVRPLYGPLQPTAGDTPSSDSGASSSGESADSAAGDGPDVSRWQEVEAHRGLLGALRARDAERATAIMHVYLQRSTANER